MLIFLQSYVRKKKNDNLELSRHLTSNLMYLTRKEQSNSLVMTAMFASYTSDFYEYLFSCFYHGINVYKLTDIKSCVRVAVQIRPLAKIIPSSLPRGDRSVTTRAEANKLSNILK